MGVDIGGVIIDRVNDGTDTSFFSDNYLETSAVPTVFDAIRLLVEKRFGENMFLVSKCGARTEERTRNWLEHRNFFTFTGMKREHLRFCRERHEKAPICTELGITHFVDDRLEVLSYLTSVRTRYLFRPNPKEVKRFASVLGEVKQVNNWQEILRDELP
jgi:hypothetical protein